MVRNHVVVAVGLKIAFEISFSCGDAVSQRVSGTVSSNE